MWLFVEMIFQSVTDVTFDRVMWKKVIPLIQERERKRIKHFEWTKLTKMQTVYSQRMEGKKIYKMLFTIWITYIVWFIDSLSLLLCVCVYLFLFLCFVLAFVLVYSFRICIVAIHLHGKHSRYTSTTHCTMYITHYYCEENNNKRLPFAFSHWTKLFFDDFKHLLRVFIFQIVCHYLYW